MTNISIEPDDVAPLIRYEMVFPRCKAPQGNIDENELGNENGCVGEFALSGANEQLEEAYEHGLADLGCLELDFERARILHSLMRATVAYDAEHEKHAKRAVKKRAWLDEWSDQIARTVSLAWAVDKGYFLGGDDLYAEIVRLLAERPDDSWLWLVALEATCFAPYAPLHGNNDKLYKGLSMVSDYLVEVFCRRQRVVSQTELEKLRKQFKSVQGKLDGANVRKAVGAAGTVAIVAATGGFAFYFAPAIAPALAAVLGAETATLSGAALTSASLAFLGGGALAAGGFGMAGGTMLIAGGGALLGAVGGTGANAALSMAMAADGGYVLAECAKIVTYCEGVLIKQYDDTASVARIHAALSRRILELDVQIEAIKRGTPPESEPDDIKGALSPKKAAKILTHSKKYLQKAADELAASLKSARTSHPSQ